MTAPERIWLQDGGDFDAASEVTWCQHSIDDADTEYVRADLSAIDVHPDPRDAVIARLVGALGDAQYGLSWAVRYFKDQDVTKDDPCPPCTRGLSATRNALAAAKAVTHD